MTTAADHLIARSNRLGADLRNAKYARGTTAARAIETDTRTDASSYRCRVTEVRHGALNQPTDGQTYF